MEQKEKKKSKVSIDEDKDVFLSFINKRIRNARKKIEQIEELEKKDKDTLKAEQIEKIKSRPDVEEQIKYYNTIKDLYYSALKPSNKKDQKDSETADDGEKDLFLSFINKKVRNASKKLDQIAELEKRDKDTLKPEQIEKIKSRSETESILQYNNEIKDLYLSALKTSKDDEKRE